MDTDDLSKNTYDAVIIEAERFHHDLTLQFGLLASRANSDDEYLDLAEEMIGHWKTKWDINELMVEIFYDNTPAIADFEACLFSIIENIKKVREIPQEQREFEEW